MATAALVLPAKEVCDMCGRIKEGNAMPIVTMSCSHAFCHKCLFQKFHSKENCNIDECNTDFMTVSLVAFINIHNLVSTLILGLYIFDV